MLHLLKIEWLKIKNYRTFWVLLVLMTISIPSFCYIVYDITDNSFPKVGGKSILGSPFAFPDIWSTATWFSSLVLFIPAVLVITHNTNEFIYKTHRQNIIDGWRRSQYISVKIVEVFLLAVFTTVLVFGTIMTFGYNHLKAAETVNIWQDSRYLGFFFIEALSYLMVSLVISVLIKRAGLAMGIYFLYAIILEQIVVQLLKRYINDKSPFSDIGRFLPLETTDRLIPQPFLRRFLSSNEGADWKHSLPYLLTVAIVYLLIYVFICHWKFRKNDL